jgi:hypothetical protein
MSAEAAAEDASVRASQSNPRILIELNPAPFAELAKSFHCSHIKCQNGARKFNNNLKVD